MTDIAIFIVIPFLSLAILLAIFRLVRGPGSPDRVLALDLMVSFGIGVVTVQAIAANEPVFIDVAVVLALVAFLATVAFAYYLEKRIDE